MLNIKKNIVQYSLIGILYGVTFYLICYGIKLLDPTYLDWIYNLPGSDLFKQQIGFEFFRKAEWRFPIGTYVGYRYPSINTIIESDFLPLLGLFFKLISRFIPENFTYLAWWILICFIMQGLVAALILRKLNINKIITIFALPFFYCNVMFLRRIYGHLMLCGHFLILIAILICLYEGKLEKTWKMTTVWAILNTISLATHPYLFVMVGVIFMSFIFYDFLNTRDIKRQMVVILVSVCSVVVLWYLLGGFTIEKAGGTGLGMYSMNINAPLNPIWGASRFLKEQATIDPSYQWEGESYLGLGLIILLILLIPYGKSNVRSVFNNKKNSWVAISFFVVICTVLALSPVVTYGSKELFNYMWFPLVKVLEPVRATGRFFWPVWYVILLFAIYRISHCEKNKYKLYVMILVCSILQYVDTSTMIQKDWGDGKFSYEESAFTKSMYLLINSNAKHFELIPDKVDTEYSELALYAVHHDMTMNIAQLTRSYGDPYLGDVIEQIETGNYVQDTVYCIPLSYLHNIKISFTEDVYMVKAEDFLVIYSKTLALHEPETFMLIDENELKEMSYSKINIGQEITLYGEEAQKYVVHGLSIYEDSDFSWTDRNSVGFYFDFSEDDTINAGDQIKAVFDLADVYLGEQNVEILIDGNLLRNQIVLAGSDFTFDFVLSEDKMVNITLNLPTAISPLERGESDDPRVLALGMKSVRFDIETD